MYGPTSLVSHFPRSQTPSVTAGLKCPPEICPPAKIITISAEPIASGASGPATWPIAAQPAVEREPRLRELRLVVPQSLTIRVITRGRTQVPVGAHLTVAVVRMERTPRRVHRDVIEVNAQAVPLGVSIGEEAALQHFVGREA